MSVLLRSSLTTNLQLSPHEAAKKLLNRRRARTSLLAFTEATFPGYRGEPVHALIAEALDKVVNSECLRLMIFAPPQHGKSELASVRLPAFWLGRHPDESVILTSYAAGLAYGKSRQARAVVESDVYRRLFPGIKTDPNSRAVDDWWLASPHRGTMLAAGVGGPITGRGAMLGIIDDPVENWEQAQSLVYRERAWMWYTTTFRTRIQEGGAIVIIMSRWHEDDLAGRLLQKQAEEWTVLRLPALGETQKERDGNDIRLGLKPGQADPLKRTPGEPLCPKRFSVATLESLRNDVGAQGWASEYSGTPRSLEGNRFKREWFPIVDGVPMVAARVRYWDKAASLSKEAAFTAGVLVAYSPEGIAYVENAVRGHWSSGNREQVILQTAQVDAQKYGNTVLIVLEQEPGSGGLDSVRDSIHNLRAFPVVADKVTGSKDVRLEPFARQAEAQNVRLVRGLWNGEFIEELCSIPNGRYRDQSDATAGAYNKLVGDIGQTSEIFTFEDRVEISPF